MCLFKVQNFFKLFIGFWRKKTGKVGVRKDPCHSVTVRTSAPPMKWIIVNSHCIGITYLTPETAMWSKTRKARRHVNGLPKFLVQGCGSMLFKFHSITPIITQTPITPKLANIKIIRPVAV
jgi:hypothetical protein